MAKEPPYTTIAILAVSAVFALVMVRYYDGKLDPYRGQLTTIIRKHWDKPAKLYEFLRGIE